MTPDYGGESQAGRVAIYYLPASDDPLYQAGAQWLGRDPDSNVRLRQPDIPDIDAVTAAARIYGFHATLKPPMHLAGDVEWFAFLQAARRLAMATAPFDLPTLAVEEIGGFLALRETSPCSALGALADACVEQLDAFRAPPVEAELAQRRGGLTAAQEALLVRWGYPYVFREWFFHMTLTRRLTEAEQDRWRPLAEAHFAAALALPRRLVDLCILTQSAPGQPFVAAERLPLRG